MQAYNFRVCLTDVPENRVPMEKPAAYNPLDYELLARHIATMKNVKPGPRKHAAIGLRGNGGDLGINFELVPNRKTDSNSGSEFGSDLIGRSYGWAEADYAGRAAALGGAPATTRSACSGFSASDPRLPEAVRAEMQRWGWPKDEFAGNGHFPHQLYVREARRMVSDFVVTENDARGTRVAEDSVALASYPLDSHGVTLYVDEAGQLWRERGFFVGIKPFPISYRSLRPRAEECENLLAVSCLSASHAAYGSVRMEPVFMMLGHAAGTAASVAIDERVSLQKVPYPALRKLLLAQGQILERDAARPPWTNESAAPVPNVAADVKLAKNLQTLVERKIIIDAAYWQQFAVKGQHCDGERVAELFLAMAKTFEPVKTVSEAINVLQAKRIFSSREYWLERAAAGRKCSGDYVAGIIEKFVKAKP